jgi:PAS domain S-box-containing protein/diguanylate cyclase (GGDEF)-like protein
MLPIAQEAARPDSHAVPLEALVTLLEASGEGVLLANLDDPHLTLTFVNGAFETITGYSREEVIGKDCSFLQGADQLQPEIARINEAIERRAPVSCTLRNYRKDGALFWNALRLVPVVDRTGRATHFLGLMRDVTAPRQALEQLDRAGRIDLLTGCLNRHAIIGRLEALLAQPSGCLLVVKLNVARFHEINTGFGHEVGDMALREIARRLGALRPDAVARIGGDEFAVAKALGSREHVEPWLDRLHAELTRAYVLPAATIEVRFATGFVVAEPGSDAIAVIRQAGTALHESKTSRLRETREFDGADVLRLQNRLRLTSDLQQALANDEFLFHYQPKFDLRTGQIVGAEALIRWGHGVFGVQRPARFIALAEENGLILDIGRWGRRAAARFAAEINAARSTPLSISVNVSAVELTHRDFIASLAEALAVSGADPSWLTLELTETLVAQDTPEILGLFRRLRELGVGLSVDDFGTGYSSLCYLDRFPITEIKIDRSFVADLRRSASKRIIVGAVIDLGRAQGIDVVAEGVETEADRQALREMGCPLAQGFILSPPLDPARFKAFIERAAGPPAEE